jgi:hypothetical protein
VTLKRQSAGARSYVDRNLTTGVKYRYRMRALRAVDEGQTMAYSAFSTTCSAVPKLGRVSQRAPRAGRRYLTVKWRRQAGASGYQVRYSRSSKFRRAGYKTVKGYSRRYLKVKRLKSKKRYYTAVRAYRKAGGRKVYGPWSVKRVKKVR